MTPVTLRPFGALKHWSPRDKTKIMRTLDQGETAAVERQHPPISPAQPVASLDLRTAKAGFAGDPRAGLRKLATLQGLQQITCIDEATALVTREPLIEQPLSPGPKRRANLGPDPCRRDRLGYFRNKLPVKPCRANGVRQRLKILPRQHGHAHRTLRPVRFLENKPRDRNDPDPPAIPHRALCGQKREFITAMRIRRC